MTMLELSIIIPAYNEETLIVNTLESLHLYMAARDEQYKIIVVDDDSQDKTAVSAPGPTLGRGTNLILAKRFSLPAGSLGEEVQQLVSAPLFHLCSHPLENGLACLIYG